MRGSKYSIVPTVQANGCWVSNGTRDRKGYVKVRTVRHGKTVWQRHRLAWIEANGRLPGEGLVIMHTCDNPPCENPDHLVEGSYRENNLDAISKGRRQKRPTKKES